jgi:predicted nucleotidyltransferase
MSGQSTLPDRPATQEEAHRVARACASLLRERFGVKRVYLCGSAAGESPWHGRSDLDLAVEGLPRGRYFEALGALWPLLPEGLELDLIPLEATPPFLARRLRAHPLDEQPEEAQEQMTTKDPREALEIEVREELGHLERMAQELKAWWRTVAGHEQKEPTSLELRALGSILHDFYSAAERVFERIAIRIDEDLPVGPRWHTDLLRRMEHPWSEKRQPVVSRDLALRLHRYMRFRHAFRHMYGYELAWEELRPLAETLPHVLSELKDQLEAFLRKL